MVWNTQKNFYLIQKFGMGSKWQINSSCKKSLDGHSELFTPKPEERQTSTHSTIFKKLTYTYKYRVQKYYLQ